MNLATPALALALLILPLTSTACGGPSPPQATTDGTTTDGTTTDGTTTDGKMEKRFGEITNFGHRTLLIDDQEIDKKVDLFEHDLLVTDQDGFVEFALRSGTNCDMRQNSVVALTPTSDAPLDFRDGNFWCSTEQGGQKTEYYFVKGARLRVDSQVFGVQFEGGQAIVKVIYGSVVVESTNGEQRTLVPELQMPIRANGTFASEPEEIQLTTDDRGRAEALQRKLAPIQVVPPSAGATGVLGEVVNTQKLSVAVDSTDPSAARFSEAFATALATAWHVDVNVVAVDAETASAGLADQTYDIVVTPADVETVNTSTVPLFDDASGRTWSLNVARDDAFATSLKRFVSTYVLNGMYAERYKQTIAPNITYKPVQGIAIPG